MLQYCSDQLGTVAKTLANICFGGRKLAIDTIDVALCSSFLFISMA